MLPIKASPEVVDLRDDRDYLHENRGALGFSRKVKMTRMEINVEKQATASSMLNICCLYVSID